MTLPYNKPVSFQTVLDALMNRDNPFPPTYLHRFSDLDRIDQAELEKIWEFIPLERRRSLLEDLEELNDADTLVSFDTLAIFALDDDDPQVRASAIRLLWETNDKKLGPVFIRIMENDSDVEVRAAAANILGGFIYLGEIEEIPANLLAKVENSLLKVTQGKDQSLVRRRALESLGFSSRPEVPGLLRQAFTSGKPEWLESALFAMGRSADQVWEEDVLDQLSNPSPVIQEAAVRAAGELSLESARTTLLEILAEVEDDDLWASTIWSLSQIGGEHVRPTLERLLDETEDDDEVSILEEALDNLSFTEDMADFGLLEFGPDGDPLIIEPDDDDRPGPKKRGSTSSSKN